MKQGQFPAILPLANLNGQNGLNSMVKTLVIKVDFPSAGLGTSMVMGMTDLIIGAYGYPAGSAKVVVMSY